MAIFRFYHSRLTKAVVPSVLGLAALALVQNASAQYSSNFDSSYPYDPGFSLSGQDNWTTNDLSTGATYTYSGGTASTARSIGQSDGLFSPASYQAPNNPNDQQAFLGGDNVPAGAVPGSGLVYVSHATNIAPTSGFVFNTDFVVTAPAVDGNGAATNAHDQFGFTFLSGASDNAGSTPLFNINFQLGSASATAQQLASRDNVSYTVGGAPSLGTPVQSLTLGSRYHLTVSVNVGATSNTFSASFTAENPNGTITAGTPVQAVANNVAFTGTVTDFAAYWKLANLTTTPSNSGATTSSNNQAYLNAGSNLIILDNVSTAVPEPSTYAFFGAGLLGLATFARSRRAQRA